MFRHAMTGRKRFLLRIDPTAYAELEKWAADDLRSVNAQIEYLLLQALEKAGRRRKRGAQANGATHPQADEDVGGPEPRSGTEDSRDA